MKKPRSLRGRGSSTVDHLPLQSFPLGSANVRVPFYFSTARNWPLSLKLPSRNAGRVSCVLDLHRLCDQLRRRSLPSRASPRSTSTRKTASASSHPQLQLSPLQVVRLMQHYLDLIASLQMKTHHATDAFLW
jgi:hypothetical protein